MLRPKTTKRSDGRHQCYYLCPHHYNQEQSVSLLAKNWELKLSAGKNARPVSTNSLQGKIVCNKYKHVVYPANKSDSAYALAVQIHLNKHERKLYELKEAKPSATKTVDELAKVHIQKCVQKQGSKGFSKSYNSIRERVLRNYILKYLGAKKIGSIQERDLINYYSDLLTEFLQEDLGSVLYLHIIVVTKQVFDFAYNNHYIDKNPYTQRVSSSANKNKKNIAETLGETNRVNVDVDLVTDFTYFVQEIAETDNRFIQLAQYMLVALHIGTRSSETTGIFTEDIDFKNKQIHINRQLKKHYGTQYDAIDTVVDITRLKTSNGKRIIPLSDELINLFMKIDAEYDEGLRKPDSLGNKTLWQDENGNPLPSTHFQAMLRTFLRNYDDDFKKRFDSKYPYRFHALRHACISIWIRADINPYTVKTWAGHQSIKTTYDVYGHEIDSKQIKFNMSDVIGQKGSREDGRD